MEDTFGRLPDDILKYMCLLNVEPKITLEENTVIQIELPLLGICYNFCLKSKEFLMKEEIEMLVSFINEINDNKLNIDFGESWIHMSNKFIVFMDKYSTMNISIKYLPIIKNILEEYKHYLLS